MQAFAQLFTKCAVPVNISVRDITSSLITCSYMNPYNRRTGRGHANDMLHRDWPRFVVANKKVSQERNKVFINEVIKKEVEKSLKVDIGPTFKVMDVYWLAKGNKSDEITDKVLKGSEDFVRKRLSESLGSHNIPRLAFVAECKHLVEQEMNCLFEKADYGMQYRALSHTGAVFGSMADAGSPNDSNNTQNKNISVKKLRNVARVQPWTSKGITDLLLLNFMRLNTACPSKKLSGQNYPLTI
ncbi:hypothetical protein DINM_002692 [Dirofilaria immitis]|nr:hypothetical protein [Dirofilaria immitis]